jgi:hypothetical protein
MAGASAAILLAQAHESSSASPVVESRRRFSSLAMGGAARPGRRQSILREEADLRGQLPGSDGLLDARCVRVHVHRRHGDVQLLVLRPGRWSNQTILNSLPVGISLVNRTSPQPMEAPTDAAHLRHDPEQPMPRWMVHPLDRKRRSWDWLILLLVRDRLLVPPPFALTPSLGQVLYSLVMVPWTVAFSVHDSCDSAAAAHEGCVPDAVKVWRRGIVIWTHACLSRACAVPGPGGGHLLLAGRGIEF